MKFLIVEPSPLPKYSLQDPVFKYLDSSLNVRDHVFIVIGLTNKESMYSSILIFVYIPYLHNFLQTLSERVFT